MGNPFVTLPSDVSQMSKEFVGQTITDGLFIFRMCRQFDFVFRPSLPHRVHRRFMARISSLTPKLLRPRLIPLAFVLPSLILRTSLRPVAYVCRRTNRILLRPQDGHRG